MKVYIKDFATFAFASSTRKISEDNVFDVSRNMNGIRQKLHFDHLGLSVAKLYVENNVNGFLV